MHFGEDDKYPCFGTRLIGLMNIEVSYRLLYLQTSDLLVSYIMYLLDCILVVSPLRQLWISNCNLIVCLVSNNSPIFRTHAKLSGKLCFVGCGTSIILCTYITNCSRHIGTYMLYKYLSFTYYSSSVWTQNNACETACVMRTF